MKRECKGRVRREERDYAVLRVVTRVFSGSCSKRRPRITCPASFERWAYARSEARWRARGMRSDGRTGEDSGF